MNKKMIVLIITLALILSGCGTAASEERNVVESKSTAESTAESIAEAIKEPTKELAEDSAEDLLDLFIDGELMAYYSNTDQEPFYITDLPLNVTDDWFSYSVGDRVDLDNDGESELILNGPYGGMYFDARDGQVFVLAFGDGTAATLGYTVFDGRTWIVHSDITHGGRKIYDFTLYDGEGCVADQFRLSKEYWETPDEPDGPGTVYTYRDETISKEEYDQLMEKIFPD